MYKNRSSTGNNLCGQRIAALRLARTLRLSQRAAVQGIRIAAERKRNVRSADPTVDVGPTSALRASSQ